MISLSLLNVFIIAAWKSLSAKSNMWKLSETFLLSFFPFIMEVTLLIFFCWSHILCLKLDILHKNCHNCGFWFPPKRFLSLLIFFCLFNCLLGINLWNLSALCPMIPDVCSFVLFLVFIFKLDFLRVFIMPVSLNA